MASPLPFQLASIRHHVDVIRRHGVSADASVPGFGKTFVAAFVARELGMELGVVCPKSVIGHWHDAIASVGIPEYRFVTNYERAKHPSFVHGRWLVAGRKYEWALPEKTLLVFDEAHRCKSRTTQNAKLLVAAARQKIPTLLLSATLAQDPLDLYAIGYALGLHRGVDYLSWAFGYGVVRGRFTFEFRGGAPALTRLHRAIFPEHGCRLSYDEIPGFPDEVTDTIALDVSTQDVRRIDDLWAEVAELQRVSQEAILPITARLRARQIAELLKVPGLIELGRDAIADGSAPVFFVSFRETLSQLQAAFPDFGRIDGDQHFTERNQIVADFSADRIPGILCQTQAGGVGVSLHDVRGERPRVSFISPPESARDLIQVLGRTRRVGGKSPAIRHVVFVEGSIEEKVRRAVERKVGQIDMINDGDLDPLSTIVY